MQRRHFVLSTAAGIAALAQPLARAQGLPERATILAGFAAGGTVDVTARRVADKLRDVLARSVVVDNRTGAGGQIALSALKTASADGLTLLVTPMSMLGIYPHTYKRLPYDPVADFQPVSQAVRFDFGFAVGPMVPASVKTLQDFIAWCKANPKDANFGSPAAGSVPHFVAELFGRAAGIDLKHVPYRGTQPAITDLIGGTVAAVSGPVGEFLQHLPGGKVRLLATSGAARSKFCAGRGHLCRAGLQGHRVRRVVRHLHAGQGAGRCGEPGQRGHPRRAGCAGSGGRAGPDGPGGTALGPGRTGRPAEEGQRALGAADQDHRFHGGFLT